MDISTYFPTTNILNDENAEMEIVYIADTKTYIDNKFKELSTAVIAMGGESSV